MSTLGHHDPLRPTSIGEFGGQPDLTGQLETVLGAHNKRGELPPHVLLYGPAGLGKTTLANIIANEVDAHLVSVTGPSLEKPGDVAALLTGLSGRVVVFIDEIHALPRAAEEILYPAMEDFRIDLLVGDATAKQVINLDLDPFTLVGATTEAGKLTKPLRDRFKFTGRLTPYDVADLAAIVHRSADLLELAVEPDAALELASRSRGTPRVANRLLRLVRDWATMNDVTVLDVDAMIAGLEAFQIDELGLDPVARDVLRCLCDARTTIGLNHLAAVVGESPQTIEDVIEPQLLTHGLMARTPRGRVATEAGYTHLGLRAPEEQPPAPRPVRVPTPRISRPRPSGSDVQLPLE